MGDDKNTLVLGRASKTYRVFTVTDLALHRRAPTNPHSLLRQLSRSFRSGKPGRAHGSGFRAMEDGTGKMTIDAFLPFTEEDKKTLAEMSARGEEIVIIMPRRTPLYLKD